MGRLLGRTREMSELTDALDQIAGGRGRCFLVSGEPGIGKSRLLNEVAVIGEDRGFAVLWGRCWEDAGAPALWPWAQIVRAASRAAGDAGAEDLTTQLEDSSGHDFGARFLVFSSVVERLRAAASSRPLAIMLDDVHAADNATLTLLAFAALELHDAPVLIVATYRDVDVRRSPELGRTIADIARLARTLQLHGLDESDVATLVESSAGQPQSAAFVRSIHEATGGNPFFVDEIARQRRDNDAPDEAVALPNSVRDAVRATLRPLSDASRQLLELAAVIGRRFDPDVVAAATERDTDDVIDALIASGVVIAEAAGTYAFSHALVRDTIYDDLRPGARVRLHGRARDVLETRPDADARAAELAHHAFSAAQGGGAEQAVRFGRLAGQEAMRAFAYAEAAEHFTRASLALDLCDADESLRCDLLVELAVALDHAGQIQRANAAARRGAELARQLGDAKRMALAVRAMSMEAAFGSVVDDEVRLVDAALEALGPADGVDRAILLARRAQLAAAHDRSASAVAADEAVAIARRCDDDEALATTLIYANRARWGPDTLGARLAACEEILSLRVSSEARFVALAASAASWLELGEKRKAADAVRRLGVVAGELMQPDYRWQAHLLEAMLAALDGRSDDAERIAAQGLEVGLLVREEDAIATFAALVATVRKDQGRFGEVEEQLGGFVTRQPTVPVWRCALAVLYAQDGRVELARQTLDAVSIDDIPRDLGWLLSHVMIAEAAIAIGDTTLAARAYDTLVPYSGRVVLVGTATCYGPVDRTLAQVAAMLGRLDDAERLLDAATATSARMGARMWEAHLLRDRARLLRARGDDDAAAHVLAAADDADRSLGLGGSHRAAANDERAVPSLTPLRSALIRDGAAWVVRHEGAEFRVRDSNGMRYLAYLLQRSGRELHALDLVSALRGPGGKVPSGDAGAAIDPAAREAYRARIEELRADLAEAEDRGDADAAGRAQDEIDAIAHELQAAMGLGGRSRTAASEAEKARLNVTRSIRTSIKAIDRLSPSLGHYLETTVKTGTFCSYVPDPRFPVVWDV